MRQVDLGVLFWLAVYTFIQFVHTLTPINYNPIIGIVVCSTATNNDKSDNLGGFHSQFSFWVHDI